MAIHTFATTILEALDCVRDALQRTGHCEVHQLPGGGNRYRYRIDMLLGVDVEAQAKEKTDA